MNAISRTRLAGTILATAGIVAVAILPLGTGPVQAAATVDRALVDALVAKDLDGARAALESGADPNAVLGPDTTDHAMCAAIDTRGTEALELLLEFDARIDWVATDGRRYLRSPIACAISYYNPDAFDLLLELGADPDANLCQDCSAPFGHSPLTRALAGSKWPMALELVRRTTLEDYEIRNLRFALERTPYDAYHPWADDRLALIREVRALGIDVDPLPMNEGPPGTVPRCVLSSRDIEEGRSEGTICP